MKILPRFAAFALAVFAPSLVCADVQPPVAGSASSSAERSMAGEFNGTWRNDTDGGKLRLSLKQNTEKWTAEATFTFQEKEIPTKVTSLKVNGAKIEIVLAWFIDEVPGQSRMIGELSGAKIEGTYESEMPEATSSGTWTVTRT
jgi:hypothetical protein